MQHFPEALQLEGAPESHCRRSSSEHITAFRSLYLPHKHCLSVSVCLSLSGAHKWLSKTERAALAAAGKPAWRKPLHSSAFLHP